MTPILLALALASLPTSAPSGRQLAITGYAKVSFRPNRVVATLALTSQQRDPKGAGKALEAATQKVLAALRGAGIEAHDVTLSDLAVGPQYRGNEVTGHQATRTVTATFTDLAKIDPALAAALHAGATPVGQVLISNTDHARFENQARVAAAIDARQRAKAVLEALGARAGLPSAVTDQTPVVDTVYAGSFAAPADGALATGFAGRELTVVSQVTVHFDIDAPN